jgi:hypothetical protein
MTAYEAKQIIEILFTTDGGCKYCVTDLVTLFYKEFPEYKEIAEKPFKKRFGVNQKVL